MSKNGLYDIDDMREKVFRIVDPNDSYSQEDFDKEFNGAKLATLNVNEDFYKIKINILNTSSNLDPEYATNGSSGFDFRANLSKPMVIPVGKIGMVPTGLFFELNNGLEIQVRPRSGLAAKHGVTVLNTPGTIDADYRGEVQVILINHGEKDFEINHGDRIAQGILATVLTKQNIKFNKVNEINEKTERGTGGFGSTGSN